MLRNLWFVTNCLKWRTCTSPDSYETNLNGKSVCSTVGRKKGPNVSSPASNLQRNSAVSHALSAFVHRPSRTCTTPNLQIRRHPKAVSHSSFYAYTQKNRSRAVGFVNPFLICSSCNGPHGLPDPFSWASMGEIFSRLSLTRCVHSARLLHNCPARKEKGEGKETSFPSLFISDQDIVSARKNERGVEHLRPLIPLRYHSLTARISVSQMRARVGTGKGGR